MFKMLSVAPFGKKLSLILKLSNKKFLFGISLLAEAEHSKIQNQGKPCTLPTLQKVDSRTFSVRSKATTSALSKTRLKFKNHTKVQNCCGVKARYNKRKRQPSQKSSRCRGGCYKAVQSRIEGQEETHVIQINWEPGSDLPPTSPVSLSPCTDLFFSTISTAVKPQSPRNPQNRLFAKQFISTWQIAR